MRQDTLLLEERAFIEEVGDHGTIEILALYGRVASRCKKQLANVRYRYNAARQDSMRAVDPPLTISELERRAQSNAECHQVAELLRGLLVAHEERDGMDDYVECGSLGESGVQEAGNTLHVARMEMLKYVVCFSQLLRGD